MYRVKFPTTKNSKREHSMAIGEVELLGVFREDSAEGQGGGGLLSSRGMRRFVRVAAPAFLDDILFVPGNEMGEEIVLLGDAQETSVPSENPSAGLPKEIQLVREEIVLLIDVVGPSEEIQPSLTRSYRTTSECYWPRWCLRCTSSHLRAGAPPRTASKYFRNCSHDGAH